MRRAMLLREWAVVMQALPVRENRHLGNRTVGKPGTRGLAELDPCPFWKFIQHWARS